MTKSGKAIFLIGFMFSLSMGMTGLSGIVNAQDKTESVKEAEGDRKTLRDIRHLIGKVHDISLDGVTIRVPELLDTELDDSSEGEPPGYVVKLRLKRTLSFGVMTYLYSFSEPVGEHATTTDAFARIRETLEKRTGAELGIVWHDEQTGSQEPAINTKIWMDDEEGIIVSYAGKTRVNGDEFNTILFECHMPIKNRLCRIALTGIGRHEIKPQNLFISLLLWRRVIIIANTEEE